MEVWPLATAVALIGLALLAMRWGNALRRTGETAAATVRSLPGNVRTFSIAALLEAGAVTSLVYALTHTHLVAAKCPAGIDLLNCYRSARNTELIVLGACLALAGIGVYLSSRLRRNA